MILTTLKPQNQLECVESWNQEIIDCKKLTFSVVHSETITMFEFNDFNDSDVFMAPWLSLKY